MTRPEDWYAACSTLEWRGHRIPWRYDPVRGAETIVLVHGFPTASWDWHRVWPELSTHFGLLASDLLGFGWAAKPYPHRYSLLEQADLVTDVMDAAGVERAHLVVHDYGVSVGQELLARQAETSGDRFLSGTFLNGGLFPEHHRARLIQRLLAGPLGPLLIRLQGRKQFGRSFSAVFGPDTQPDSDELDACWALIEKSHGRRVLPPLLGYMAERRTHAERWERALTDTEVPLCLINGTLDPVSGGHLADAFAARVPRGRIVRLTAVGHYPQLEAPGPVAQAILEHVRGSVASAGP